MSDFRVDFIIIGAQKSGTTSLSMQLADHPEICFCQEKEPGYFNARRDWKNGIEKYHELYRSNGKQLCGEASTMYTFLPEFEDTHSRIFEYNPKIKLIYIMRQPVERIVSHYAHRVITGRVKEKPEIAVLKDPNYINRSRYAVQIKPYIKLFGRKNLHLLLFEDYVVNQEKCLSGIASFLGISPALFPNLDKTARNRSIGKAYFEPQGRKLRNLPPIKAIQPIVPSAVKKAIKSYFSNELKEKPQFSAELKAILWMFLEDDVRTIEELLGRCLDVWRQGY